MHSLRYWITHNWFLKASSILLAAGLWIAVGNGTSSEVVVRTLPVAPMIVGRPADGFQVGRIIVDPATVRVEGPENRVRNMNSIPTMPVHIEGKNSSIMEAVALNPGEGQVRIPASSVDVQVEIRAK